MRKCAFFIYNTVHKKIGLPINKRCSLSKACSKEKQMVYLSKMREDEET